MPILEGIYTKIRGMEMDFKFEDFEYEIDPEFQNVEKVSVESLINVPIIFDYVKFNTTHDGKETITARVQLEDGSKKFIYTGAYKVVGQLKRIMDSEGVIPRIPAKIVATPNAKGNNSYKIVNA